MHQIIYMSQAKESTTVSSLVVILMQARSLNERHNITGILVYGQKQFMQLIEGEEAAVTELYERIARDPRHQNVFKLADKAIEERTFAQWSMAFEEVSAAQFRDLTGYVSPEELAEQLATSSEADKVLLDKMKELVGAS
jgi:hypothetical protein